MRIQPGELCVGNESGAGPDGEMSMASIHRVAGRLEGNGPMVGACIVGLAGLLFAAAWYDTRQHRIPNRLVMLGAFAGLAIRFWSEGAAGALESIEGFAVGLLLLFPFYLMRTLGAGDVKLMAAVGAFLGPQGVLGAVLATFIAGGLMALLLAARRKLFGPLIENLKLMAMGSLLEIGLGRVPKVNRNMKSVGKLPYALAIGMGVTGWLVWQSGR